MDFLVFDISIGSETPVINQNESRDEQTSNANDFVSHSLTLKK